MSDGRTQGSCRVHRLWIAVLYSAGIVLLVIGLCAASALRNTVWADKILLWENAVRNHSQKSRSYNFLGLAYKEGNRIDDAMLTFRQAIKLDPGNADARFNLADALLQQGRRDEAVSEFERVIRMEPVNGKYAVAHFVMGEVYYNQGRIDDAAREFQVLVSLKPSSSYAHNNLGVIYLRQRRVDEAIREFRLALTISPDYAVARQNLERTLSQTGQRRAVPPSP